jgi:hypothetical protein
VTVVLGRFRPDGQEYAVAVEEKGRAGIGDWGLGVGRCRWKVSEKVPEKMSEKVSEKKSNIAVDGVSFRNDLPPWCRFPPPQGLGIGDCLWPCQ